MSAIPYKRPAQTAAHRDETEKLSANHDDQKAKDRMSTASNFPTFSLLAFVILSTFALVVIVALLRWSKQNNGIGPSLSTYSYLWKFGPALVFAIASGFWNQSADHIRESTVRRPVQNSDKLNAVATFGRVLTAMTMAFSFQLLESQCVKLDRAPITLVAHSEFSGAGYNGEVVDAKPALTVAGINGLGLPYPTGTTSEHAFSPFSAAVQSRDVGGLVSGIVDLFTPDLECEVASVTNSVPGCSSVGCREYKLGLTLSTPTCREYQVSPFEKASDSIDGYYTDVVFASCTGADSMTRDRKLIFVAAHWNRNTPKASSIVCKPRYSISQGHVSLNQRNGSTYMVVPFQINNRLSERQISGVTAGDLAAGFLSTLRTAETALSTLIEDGDLPGNPNNSDGLHYSTFRQLVNMSSPHSPEDLLDTSVLDRVARQTYTSVTVQIAKQYLLRNTHSKFEGDKFGNVNRVMVRESFARFMEATLVALIVLSTAILAWRPRAGNLAR